MGDHLAGKTVKGKVYISDFHISRFYKGVALWGKKYVTALRPGKKSANQDNTYTQTKY